MVINGWYYLHENKELVYNKNVVGIQNDFIDSNLVKAFWPVDARERHTAWCVLVEGLAGGASKERVKYLANSWKCDDEDAKRYAEYLGILISLDGKAWCATRKDFIDQMQSPVGFGSTALEAMSDLCKALGFQLTKVWGRSFEDLVRC